MTVEQPTQNSIASPVADLSYRSYDGPKKSIQTQWWPIAIVVMREAIKKKGFWVWTAMSAWIYVVFLIVLYVLSSNPLSDKIIGAIHWPDQFISGYTASQLFLVILTILFGTGQISNDFKANALLVYLSKPLNRIDYLFGKWLGIFLVLFAVSLVPMLVYYTYGILSYSSFGFFSQDRILILKLVLLAAIPAAFHASFSLGVSSAFKQARIASSVYAAVYFVFLFVASYSGASLIMYQVQNTDPPASLVNLSYASVDGVLDSLGKNLLQSDGANIDPTNSKAPKLPRPGPLPFLGAYMVICAGSLYFAYTKIKAVEVVK